MMWPPPKPDVPPPAPAAKPAEIAPPPEPNYFANSLKDSFMYTAGLASILGSVIVVIFKGHIYITCYFISSLEYLFTYIVKMGSILGEVETRLLACFS